MTHQRRIVADPFPALLHIQAACNTDIESTDSIWWLEANPGMSRISLREIMYESAGRNTSRTATRIARSPGVVFVDLSPEYDTVNHRRLPCKVLEMTGDLRMTELIGTMLQVLNRRKLMATTEKRTTTLKCAGTDVQHLH